MEFSKQLPGNKSLEVRKATRGDIPAIAKMAVKLARQHGQYDEQRFDLSVFEPLEPRHVEYLTGQFQRKDTSFLVVLLDNDIVGYAFLRIEPANFLSLDQTGVSLHDIFFEESARGRGLGTLFFNAIVKEAKTMGSAFLMLGVSPKNASGKKFFSTMGFRRTMLEMRLDF
jgi:GNAT superfamily N-acetyltransferase